MKRVVATYALLGVVLWFIPLLNVLQVESAAVVAFVAFFASGWAAVYQFRTTSAQFWTVLGQQVGALVVPLGMLTISQLWAPNCTYGQGLLFFGLFPGISVVLAVALAYLITAIDSHRPFSVLGGIGLALSLLGPVYDLGFHPQFYTYNHVFGGVLGPIYDQQLALRWGLFVFRGLTILWACAAFLGGRIIRGESGRVVLGTCVLLIGLCYYWAVPLGLNSSEAYLQTQLEGHVHTEHFDIYYSPDRLDRDAVEAVAEEHEAKYRWLVERLRVGSDHVPGRIQSYLYPNPDVKARLTGARYTSVSPVWLGRPQVHLLAGRIDASLGHELAHVFSREYGLPFLNASWSPGLVEGWAVALEPPSPYPSSHDLVRVASVTGAGGDLSTKADALSTRLTPWGFWTGRGAVSYATMGSFVDYLLDRYGPEPLKAVYADGNFESVYGRSLSVLAREWSDVLGSTPVISRSARDVVGRQFTQPSLFEVDCPHYVPPHRRHFQAAREADRRGDSSAVIQHLRKALSHESRYTAAHAELARRRLARGAVSKVRQELDTLASDYRTVRIRVLQADARVLQGESEAARRLYDRARRDLPAYAHEYSARLMVRAAAADRPDLVQILVSDDSALQQARSLSSAAEEDGAVARVWEALRYLDAHRYSEADSVWQHISRSWRPDASRSSTQSYGIQQGAWRAQAALHSKHFERAKGAANTAAGLASEYGAREWAKYLRWKARRATERQSRDSNTH